MVAQRVRAVTAHPVSVICRGLGIARQTAYYVRLPRPAGFYHRAEDDTVLQQIRAVTNSRATYGYRRVWAMVDRHFRTGYNRKRIRRVIRRHGLMLAPRVHRRHGRPHLGQVQRPASNQRWCSDVFLIPAGVARYSRWPSRSTVTTASCWPGRRRPARSPVRMSGR
jgi:transposase InsO family protein